MICSGGSPTVQDIKSWNRYNVIDHVVALCILRGDAVEFIEGADGLGFRVAKIPPVVTHMRYGWNFFHPL